jgi:hypothetical protein
MVAIVALYNLPRFFEYSLTCKTLEVQLGGLDGQDFNTTITSLSSGIDAEPMQCSRVDCETALKKLDWYNWGYENVLYCLVVFMLPLLLLIVFNVALVVELFRSHKERLNNSGGRPSVTSESDERHERNNITLVMLVIIVVFLVTQTPAYINQLLYYFLAEEEYQCGHAYFYYYHVSNLIVSSNSCLNFVIYCVCRRQFRQRLGDLRCFGWRCSQCKSCRCIRGQRESVSSTGRSSGTACTTNYTPMKCENGRSSSCAV